MDLVELVKGGGVPGAVIVTVWLFLRYMERKHSDEITELRNRVSSLETNSTGHKEWLKDHSHAIKAKASKSHVARVLNRRRDVGTPESSD